MIIPNEQPKLGLYLHLPFCARICHYCDFVKSALYTDGQKRSYIAALEGLLDDWLSVWSEMPGVPPRFTSVFWGGGTPSLVTTELTGIMQKILAHTAPHAEITLEANPEHITAEALSIWQDVGINRISLGVQSLNPQGLKALTREHTADEALRALELSLKAMRAVNGDLIYGWPGQTMELWQADLARLTAAGVQHASLYNLTFEGRTPFARRLERGRMEAHSDERLFEEYECARAHMAGAGFEHEEVSNWAKPGYAAEHNALYWHGGSYLGLGSGAHGFLQNLGPFGTRWQQNGNWRTFGQNPPARRIADILTREYNQIDGDRDTEGWLLETISSGLRTAKGVNLDALLRESGYSFQPRASVKQALAEGLMSFSPDGVLRLTEAEWFRETRWSLETALSCVPLS